MNGRFTVKFYLLLDESLIDIKEKYGIKTLEKLEGTQYEYVEIARSTDLLMIGIDTSLSIFAQYNQMEHPKKGEVLFVTITPRTNQVEETKLTVLQKLKLKLFGPNI